MAYCTAADVNVYVGTVVSDADLGYMIADADSEILAYFAARGITIPTGSAVAKQASILLTRVRVSERFNVTGENPTAYSSGDYSQSGVADHYNQAKTLQDRAYQLMKDEIGRLQVNYSDAATTRRSDAVIDDFKLDQNDLVEPFSEVP